MADEIRDFRTLLPGDRSSRLWIVMGLGLMATGFVVAQMGQTMQWWWEIGPSLLLTDGRWAQRSSALLFVGWSLVVSGVWVTVVTILQHAFEVLGLRKPTKTADRRSRLEIGVGLLLAGLGMAIGASLLMRR